MTAKLKSANKFTRFMLAHGEKLGMAAVLVVAGLLIKSALGRERLPDDKRPGRLSDQATAAERHFQEMSWGNMPDEERVNADKMTVIPGGGLMKPVNEDAFPPIDPPDFAVIKAVSKRTDPRLLAPSDLEISAGSGLWAFDDPDAIRKRNLAAVAKAQREAKEEADRRREEEEENRDGEGRGRRRRGGRGEGEGEGSYGRGGFDMMGMGGVEMTEDGQTAVMRPSGVGNSGMTMESMAPIRNASWVTVLAKVPIKQQVDEYREALLNSSGYNEQYDVPNYQGYQIERAEVTDDGQGDWVRSSVVKRTIIQAMEERPIEPMELVDPKYLHPLLTWPLPPMMLRTWGEEVTHSDLPLPSPEDLFAPMEGELGPEEAPVEGEGTGDDFADQMRREASSRTPAAGAYGEMGRGAYPGGGYPGGEYGGGERMPGGYGGESMMRGGYGGGYGEMSMGRGAGQYENLPDKPWDQKTKYYLFRYFDSTVKPGHRYRYRVRLVLADVNASTPERRIQEATLDDSVTARKTSGPKDKAGKPLPYLFTEWSEPSPVAAVPMPGLIYVAKVKPAATAAAEPTAQVLVKSLDAPHAAEIAAADWFTRGSVINLIKRKAEILWSNTFNKEQDEDERQRQSPEFDFVTEMTLLDFTGGQVLNGNRELLAPARALVMDATGRMSVEEELENLKPIREYNVIMEASKKAARNREENGREERGRRGGRGGGGRR